MTVITILYYKWVVMGTILYSLSLSHTLVKVVDPEAIRICRTRL